MKSPYEKKPKRSWKTVTEKLIDSHPLDCDEIVEVVLGAWKAIFESDIGGYRIGEDIFPKPQVMGFFLHELIALEFQNRHPDAWRGERAKVDKDLVYAADAKFSVEIKTSSHKSQAFGNRSYAQAQTDPKKTKSGYYIAVNFEGFSSQTPKPRVMRIRFGWLDHSDWIGQKAATGQQARIHPESEKLKLLTLYDAGADIPPGEDVFDSASEESGLEQ